MPAVANLVHETSTSTGTGNLTVAAVNGKQRFSDAFGTGSTEDVFYYFISNRAAAEWERGTGHMSDANTLVRDTVEESSNSNSAVDFSAGTKDVTNDVPAQNRREVLTADRTYHVRTDGDDGNDGLTDSAGGAFLTIQKAINVIQSSIDLGNKTITIQVADGTYNAGVLLGAAWPGAGIVKVQGNLTTPGDCIISTTGGTNDCFGVFNGAKLEVAGGFRLIATDARAFQVDLNSLVSVTGPIEFGECGLDHCHVSTAGELRFFDDYAIVGGATTHWTALNGGVVQCQSNTITITGTPDFSTAFADVKRGSVIRANGCTFSGSATGKRYDVNDAYLSCGDNDPDAYFPGDALGTWEFSTGTESVFGLTGVNGQRIQIHSQDASAGFFVCRWSNVANPGYGVFARARSSAVGTHGVVQSGDQLGQVVFSGSDGSAFQQAAIVRGEVDGTPGAADMPGRLLFMTSPDGSATPTEKLRIGASGAFVSPIANFPNFADDAAAAAGGVSVGGWYRTGSALKIRVA